jgi:FK506-binding nuclear protein
VFFTVTGTHTVYVTGNYVVTEGEEDDSDYDSEEDEDYDLPPGMDDDSELSDELDGIEGVDRIKEIDTDEEEEAPKLVTAKKGKNKRPAEEEAEGLDEMMSKDGAKLSKKQQKKLKTEAAAKEAAAAKESPASKSDKKVQFAKELEQGPTGPAKEKAEKKTGGVKVVQGVTIDDRKIGTGRTVKSGDKVGMRYIGKLENGKVFDGELQNVPNT